MLALRALRSGLQCASRWTPRSMGSSGVMPPAGRWHAEVMRRGLAGAASEFLDKNDVTSRVVEVVKKFEKVQPEKVTDSAHFMKDLGLDSLDVVELVMAFEDEFAIEIGDEDAEKIMSLSDAVEYVSNNIHAE